MAAWTCAHQTLFKCEPLVVHIDVIVFSTKVAWQKSLLIATVLCTQMRSWIKGISYFGRLCRKMYWGLRARLFDLLEESSETERQPWLPIWNSLCVLRCPGLKSLVLGGIIYFVMRMMVNLVWLAIVIKALLHSGIIHPNTIAVQFIFLWEFAL